MKLNAVKFGLATAIVAAVFWAVSILIAVVTPVGMMRGGYGWMHGGTMMRDGYAVGGYGHMYGPGWGWLAAGLVAWPLIAGLAAWGTAAIYNRLLGPTNP